MKLIKKDMYTEQIEAFLLAVLDCCQSVGKEYGMPVFVGAELSGRLFPYQIAR